MVLGIVRATTRSTLLYPVAASCYRRPRWLQHILLSSLFLHRLPRSAISWPQNGSPWTSPKAANFKLSDTPASPAPASWTAAKGVVDLHLHCAHHARRSVHPPLFPLYGAKEEFRRPPAQRDCFMFSSVLKRAVYSTLLLRVSLTKPSCSATLWPDEVAIGLQRGAFLAHFV